MPVIPQFRKELRKISHGPLQLFIVGAKFYNIQMSQNPGQCAFLAGVMNKWNVQCNIFCMYFIKQTKILKSLVFI